MHEQYYIKKSLERIMEKKHPYIIIVLMFFAMISIFLFVDTKTISNKEDVKFNALKQVAQVSYQPLAPLPGFKQTGTGAGNTIGYLQNIIFLGIGIAIVLAILMIVIGGVQYMASDAFTQKEDAKDKITMALLGLLIAFGGYLLLNTINPALVTFTLSSEKIDIKTLPSASKVQDAVQNAVETGDKYNFTDKNLLGNSQEVARIEPLENGQGFDLIVTGNLSNADIAATEIACKQKFGEKSQFSRSYDPRNLIRGTVYTCEVAQ